MAYIGKQPVVGNFVKLDAITTSATATYNLLNGGVAYFPQSANNCLVSLNGIIQEPTSSGNVGGYTISGSTIVFTSALTTLDVIDFILVLGDTLSIGTPSDGTVGFSKVTSNLITGATAETSIAGGDSVLIYDDSASALRKMTRTNFVAGVGGTNTPAFFAYKTSAQTVTNDADTLISFQTEVFDTANCYDNSSTYRFTPTTAGKYFVFTSLSSNGNGANSVRDFAIRLNFNGSYLNYTTIFSNYPNQTGKEHSGFFSTIQTFNGTSDYIAIYGRVTGTGSPLTIESGYPNSTSQNVFFGAYKLIE